MVLFMVFNATFNNISVISCHSVLLVEETSGFHGHLIIYFIWFMVLFMVFNATFNNISVISCRSVLLVEETGVPRENHRPVACH
jgi:hypothetical protein